jgi:molybdopterin converting factor subunit 1
VQIRILHFASFRDAVGRDADVRELSEGTRVRDLWASLGHEVPLFARFRAMPPAAVNREYVSGETVLQDGDEVAFLPPVAGG